LCQNSNRQRHPVVIQCSNEYKPNAEAFEIDDENQAINAPDYLLNPWVPVLQIITLTYLFILDFFSLINWQQLGFRPSELFWMGLVLTLTA
jgi:hypothetical protein